MPERKNVIADLIHVVEHSKNSTVRQIVADALAHHEISEIKKAILCSIQNEKSITATWLRALVMHIFDA